MRADPIQVGDVVIEEVDVASVSDADLETLCTFDNLLRAESNPEDPPRPVELLRAWVRNIPSFMAVWWFWARDPDGTIAATAETFVSRTDDNKHLVEAGITVRPDRRRLGIARTLLGLVAEVTEAEGRNLLVFGTSERVPAGAAFAQRVGADAGLSNHVNRLLISDIDAGLLARWVDDGPKRASGYSLVAIDGRYPDDLIEQIASVHEIMNTAPRDGLDIEDFRVTVDHIREWEQTMIAAGAERWSLFAREDATGELIAFTETAWNPKVPTIVRQLGTAVRPDHRGHALGKWLKAAMLQRVLAERAGATEVRTGNADSNDAMLGINNQLGFRPHEAGTVWQVPIERVRAYLGSSA